MKKLLSICIFTMLTTLLTAQVSKTVNVSTAGTLSALLTTTEKTTVTNLTISGIIDTRDIKCMRDEMTKLAVLDISSVTINAYNGSGGTSTSTSYSANKMPDYSFHNSYTALGKSTLTNVKLPTSITSIGSCAFQQCANLSIITLPNSINSIGVYAFDGCYALKDVTFPTSMTSTGNATFYASGLVNINLHKDISILSSNSFRFCSSLKTINCQNPIPPTIQGSCFEGSTLTAVYVPASSVAAYKAAAGWSDLFLSIIFADNTSTSYNITLQIGIGGTVKENNVVLNDGSLLSVTPSTTKTFTFTPITGYEISTLTYNGTNVKSQISNNQYTTPAVNSNATLNVTFQKIQYRISLKDASTGTINLLCDYGARPSFDFTPTTGWKVNTVLYNSTDVTSSLVNGVYTVPTITANSLLNVSFVSISTGAPELKSDRIKVYSTNSEIIVEGTSKGETVTLYTINGKQIQNIESKGERMNLQVDRDAIYLVKTGQKVFKVIL